MLKYDFRFFPDNYGCTMCMEADRNDTGLHANTLIYRIIEKTKCQKCYIYKTYLEFKELQKGTIDDGR